MRGKRKQRSSETRGLGWIFDTVVKKSLLERDRTEEFPRSILFLFQLCSYAGAIDHSCSRNAFPSSQCRKLNSIVLVQVKITITLPCNSSRSPQSQNPTMPCYISLPPLFRLPDYYIFSESADTGESEKIGLSECSCLCMHACTLLTLPLQHAVVHSCVSG